jgi:large subunit ribosomal protein L23
MAIKYPLLSEKSVSLIEKENKIIFVVEKNATKAEIKKRVEELYNIKVADVKTSINMKGEKRAFVKLIGENAASNLATKLNII